MTSENWGVWSERRSIGHAVSRSLALGASLRSSRELSLSCFALAICSASLSSRDPEVYQPSTRIRFDHYIDSVKCPVYERSRKEFQIDSAAVWPAAG